MSFESNLCNGILVRIPSLRAEGARRKPRQFPEVTRECTLITEARREGDLSERQFGRGEQVERFIQSDLHRQIPGCQVKQPMNELSKTGDTQFAKFRELLDCGRIGDPRMEGVQGLGQFRESARLDAARRSFDIP